MPKYSDRSFREKWSEVMGQSGFACFYWFVPINMQGNINLEDELCYSFWFKLIIIKVTIKQPWALLKVSLVKRTRFAEIKAIRAHMSRYPNALMTLTMTMNIQAKFIHGFVVENKPRFAFEKAVEHTVWWNIRTVFTFAATKLLLMVFVMVAFFVHFAFHNSL